MFPRFVVNRRTKVTYAVVYFDASNNVVVDWSLDYYEPRSKVDARAARALIERLRREPHACEEDLDLFASREPNDVTLTRIVQ